MRPSVEAAVCWLSVLAACVLLIIWPSWGLAAGFCLGQSAHLLALGARRLRQRRVRAALRPELARADRRRQGAQTPHPG